MLEQQTRWKQVMFKGGTQNTCFCVKNRRREKLLWPGPQSPPCTQILRWCFLAM